MIRGRSESHQSIDAAIILSELSKLWMRVLASSVIALMILGQTAASAQSGSWPRTPGYSGPQPKTSEKSGFFGRVRGFFSSDESKDATAATDSDTGWKGVLRSNGRSTPSDSKSQVKARQTTPVIQTQPSDTPRFEDNEPPYSVIPMAREVDVAEPESSGQVRVAGWNLPQPESLSPEGGIRIPLPSSGGNATITQTGELVSLDVTEVPIAQVLTLIARQHSLNVVASADVVGILSVSLKDVSLDEALTAILKVNGYTWKREGNILIVSSVNKESTTSALMQGLEVRVFPLAYISAEDASAVVTGLLSPVGKAIVTQSSSADKRKTQEQLVVEDLPEYLARVEAYIYATDNAPKQVLIEAHVLRVELSDSTRHGVDFAALLRIAGSETVLSTRGFTSPTASPAFFLSVDGTDFGAILEALKATTDAKTLASPKVLAVNGQEAKIQIGARLGYLVTTTTQTSTLQNVEFLETGIVLNVTPIIIGTS
jgi:hypothetical protein